MIPKIIHQIWIGLKPIPEEFVEFQEKWKDMYSDYQYRLWTNENVSSMYPTGELKNIYDTCSCVAGKADILRYLIIKEFGGVYIDIDTEPLKKMDFLDDLEFFTGIQTNGECAIGIFGANLNNPLINEVIEGIPSNLKNANAKGFGWEYPQKITGPEYFTPICKCYNQNGYKCFDPKYFYPYWFLEPERRYENFKVTCKEAYSVHHWANNWIK